MLTRFVPCASEPTPNGPLKCFNPSKNWRLGWYNDKSLQIGLDESWSGRLVAFVDYDLANPNNNDEVVLLRLGQFLFIQYNRAKKFNIGTSQHQDEVVAVAGEGALTSSSVLLAGLGESENYSWKGTTIQVCSLKFDPSSSMDYAEVAVYPTGTVFTCNAEMTPSPSIRTGSTLAPSQGATLLPTRPPTSAPTPHPTTSAPVTDAPVTTSPVTPAPVSPSPITQAPVTPAPSLRPSPLPTPLPSPFPVTLAPSPHPTTATPTPLPTFRPVTGAPVTFAPIAPSTLPSVHVAQWVQVGNDIDGEASGDESGRSIALSSNGAVLAIGAHWNNGGGSAAGHVRVYVNTGGGWEQQGSDLDGSAANDWFGYAVALSADGTILAVGASLADGANGPSSGRVQVYRWIADEWQRTGSAIDGEASENFGSSVALSDDGTILAVGATKSAGEAGRVRVFAWTGTDWDQRGDNLVGSSQGDRFGGSVALSSNGSIVACGSDRGNYSRVYRWSGSMWQPYGSILRGFSSFDFFGESLSLSGDGRVVAVGADVGDYVVVYRNDGTDWVQIGQTIGGDGAFGSSVSLSSDGKSVVIGGILNSSNGHFSGYALVYRQSPDGQEWLRIGQELAGEAEGDYFGISTSISDEGTRISIGAVFNDGNGHNTGHVRVYDLQ